MTYATFSTRAAAAAWLLAQRDSGLSGYIIKECEGSYTVRSW